MSVHPTVSSAPRVAPEPGSGPCSSTSSSSTPRARDHAGYTLMEMLIVMTMMGIMAGIGAPYFLKEAPARDAREEASVLANVFRQARYRATALSRPVYVHLQPDGVDGFYTAYVDMDGDPTTVPDGTEAEIDETNIPFRDHADGYDGNALRTSVSFSTGSAGTSPEPGGGTPDGALDVPDNPFYFTPMGMVRWPSGSSDFRGTIYVASDQDGEAVSAVTITRTGMISVHRLVNGSWK